MATHYFACSWPTTSVDVSFISLSCWTSTPSTRRLKHYKDMTLPSCQSIEYTFRNVVTHLMKQNFFTDVVNIMNLLDVKLLS